MPPAARSDSRLVSLLFSSMRRGYGAGLRTECERLRTVCERPVLRPAGGLLLHCHRRLGRRRLPGGTRRRPELLRPDRRAAVAKEGLSWEVADTELLVDGGEDVLAVPRGVEPAVHRLARRAIPAGTPRDVLADLVARRAFQVLGEDGAERLAARRVAELAARDVCGELRVPRVVQLRVQLQRGQSGLGARVVRQAIHRELGGRLVESELLGGWAAASARREHRRSADCGFAAGGMRAVRMPPGRAGTILRPCRRATESFGGRAPGHSGGASSSFTPGRCISTAWPAPVRPSARSPTTISRSSALAARRPSGSRGGPVSSSSSGAAGRWRSGAFRSPA